ncbi:hypothetical protein GJ744_010088 [Endocarpon pusillum]|uniref:Cell wall mannoprotein PIR1-like C-terminal domain-containing protein n=1 Tax=Endocarpon pusillum TaxID=364733 RepID=A0A8H7AIU3_9EURO|nr:hypothetical protein GJ744_010088 [Endocarpon pusillum]
MRYTIAILAAAVVVKASPFPQAVTAAISPTEKTPPGCTGSTHGSFGIAAMNVTTASAPAKRAPPQALPVSQIADGQPQVPIYTMAPVSMIMDGQVQGGLHTMEIGDGQVQASTRVTTAPVTVLSDGLPQASVVTAAPVSQISNGQTRAKASTKTLVSRVSDAQPQALAATDPAAAASNSSGTHLVACKSAGTLELTLNDGVLKDAQGRTGYIASNFQFQFDAPPQAGAIYTSGFSVCSNGSLALGGSNIFYQCRSGDFYNLYDRYWAAQCSPVTIETLALQDCA